MAAGAEVFGEAAVLEMNSPAAIVEPSSPNDRGPAGEKNMEKIENSYSEMSEESGGTNEVKGSDTNSNADSKSELGVNDIVDMLKILKLNPLAKEFFPSSYNYGHMGAYSFVFYNNNLGNDGFKNNLRRRSNNNSSRRRGGGRAFKAQREDSIRRTVYVSEVDHNITEERLAALFSSYGQVSYSSLEYFI
ncbi:Polyadenylate-binding protein-interacting protein 9 [Striga hermonthica]|uniref:Polyadenylate-binding protein-interacting protein 9 n=1 Tax=Striga hermonthica TaxID=68872 RepID=A0A9N7MV47_STRHE|nr:Polyadenylate-binding protein-interacting protein 9 [Striga hermonthica]